MMGVFRFWDKIAKSVLLILAMDLNNFVLRYLGVVLYQLIIHFDGIKSTGSEVKPVGTITNYKSEFFDTFY